MDLVNRWGYLREGCLPLRAQKKETHLRVVSCGEKKENPLDWELSNEVENMFNTEGISNNEKQLSRK